jgi:hypothetical protein
MPERSKSEKKPRTVRFSKWLKQHIERDDPVGDLARDLYDRTPMQRVSLGDADDFYTFLESLERASACQGALIAAVAAWAEYVREFPSKKVPLYCDFCREPLRRFDSEFWFHDPWRSSGFGHSRCVNARIRAERDDIDPEDHLADVLVCWGGASNALSETLRRIPLSDTSFLEKLSAFESVVSAFYSPRLPTDASSEYVYRNVLEVRDKLEMSRLLYEPLPAESFPDADGGAASFVYFFQRGEDGPIKIGFATNPDSRKAQMQTALAEKLNTLLVIPGTRKTETYLHRKFDALRLMGEWFEPDDELIDFIRQIRKTGREGLP